MFGRACETHALPNILLADKLQFAEFREKFRLPAFLASGFATSLRDVILIPARAKGCEMCATGIGDRREPEKRINLTFNKLRNFRQIHDVEVKVPFVS